MASILLSGTLKDPASELAVGDQIRFTHNTTTGDTIKSAVSLVTIDPTGTYEIELQYGLILVEYMDVRKSQFKNLGVVTVNQDSTATTLPELLVSLVPPTDEQLLEFQAILADCIAAQVAAEAAAVAADSSAQSIDVDNLPFTFDTVALYKASTITFPIGKRIYFKDRDAYANIISGTGTATGYKIIASDVVDQSADIVVDSNVVKVTAFGVVADGVLSDGTKNPTPTDNKDAIQAACDHLKRGVYSEYQGGVLEFPSGVNVCVATSGNITLPEAQIKGNGCKIRPLESEEPVFVLDLTHTSNTRRFTKNWLFERFTMYTDRGFGVDTVATDCKYLLQIKGGWLIRSDIQHIDVDPGFSCRSLVDWDLTHPDIGAGITEVGVPDAINFYKVSAQYAENTSYALSFSGDQLGTGSRASSITFTDVYNSITYPHGFITRSEATNDFGGIRIDNCYLARPKIKDIYSYNPIRQFNDSAIGGAHISTIYVEFNNPITSDFECVLRDGVYEDCVFDTLAMYTQNDVLTAPPRFFFAEFTRCTFDIITVSAKSQLTNPVDADLLNLGATSTGNTFKRKPILSRGYTDVSMAYILTKFTVPVDTVLEFVESKLLAQTVMNEISADGSYLLGTVPSANTDITAWLKTAMRAYYSTATSCDLVLRFSGSGVGADRFSSTVTVPNTSGDDVQLEGEFIGRSDLIANPTPTQFSTSAVYTFNVTGANTPPVIKGSNDLTIQNNSGAYEVWLDVSSLAGGSITVANFTLDYGHSREYVNIV